MASGGWPTAEQKENASDASELRKPAPIELNGEREGDSPAASTASGTAGVRASERERKRRKFLGENVSPNAAFSVFYFVFEKKKKQLPRRMGVRYECRRIHFPNRY
jgi:hypothetical protein